jgi:hypothetical protein
MFLISASVYNSHLHSCDYSESKNPLTVAWNVEREFVSSCAGFTLVGRQSERAFVFLLRHLETQFDSRDKLPDGFIEERSELTDSLPSSQVIYYFLKSVNNNAE